MCLASTSPARLMLLAQFGIRPLTVAPDVDEEAVIATVEAAEARTLAPDEHVLLLARRKAADVAARLRDDLPGFDGIVIGGDSMFELDGEVLGKPTDADDAAATPLSQIVNASIARLVLQKEDFSGGALKDAVFRLSGDTVAAMTYTVDDNGALTIPELPNGNYLLEEVTAPKG